MMSEISNYQLNPLNSSSAALARHLYSYDEKIEITAMMGPGPISRCLEELNVKMMLKSPEIEYTSRGSNGLRSCSEGDGKSKYQKIWLVLQVWGSQMAQGLVTHPFWVMTAKNFWLFWCRSPRKTGTRYCKRKFIVFWNPSKSEPMRLRCRDPCHLVGVRFYPLDASAWSLKIW